MLNDEEALQIFRNSGALLEGHFLLSSGLHSPTYLEKFQVLQYPRLVEKLCAEIADRFKNNHVGVVLGPTTGGVLLSYEVAKRLGTRGIFAERLEQSNERVLKRGFTIASGERVLVVDDILTTGLSVRETVKVVEEHGGELVGIGVLADRSGGSVRFSAPLNALLTLDVEQYNQEECPLCKAGVPITKRGSRPPRSEGKS